jgi:hypothetical protein
MMDLFDHAARLAQANEAKRAALVQVGANANPDWSSFMLEQVRLTALEQPRFTSDDISDRAECCKDAPTTHEKRAFGAVMKEAARLGYCKKLNIVVPSRRQKLHASPRAVWESLIYAV